MIAIGRYGLPLLAGLALWLAAAALPAEPFTELYLDDDGYEAAFEPAVSSASWLQPPPGSPATGMPPGDLLAPTSSAPRRRVRGLRSNFLAGDTPLSRLATVPHMFGDLATTAGQVRAESLNRNVQVDLPLAGGARRLKVTENNRPLPTDRVFYGYSHFHNAVLGYADLNPLGPASGSPIDRHLIGVEKTFFDGWSSLEVRMPLTSGYATSMGGGAFQMRTGGDEGGGGVGNLTLTAKQLLWVDDATAWAVGMAVELPTGSDVHGQFEGTTFDVQNRAAHLLPYVGFLSVPCEYAFVQGYVQLDFATGGNPVNLHAGVPPLSGSLRDQHLLHLDLAVGCWLYSDLDAPVLTGLAALVELHYMTTLEDARLVSLSPSGASVMTFGNQYGRLDVLNLTAGLHCELGPLTTVRVGAATPLRPLPDRFFDAEVIVSVNRFF